MAAVAVAGSCGAAVRVAAAGSIGAKGQRQPVAARKQQVAQCDCNVCCLCSVHIGSEARICGRNVAAWSVERPAVNRSRRSFCVRAAADEESTALDQAGRLSDGRPLQGIQSLKLNPDNSGYLEFPAMYLPELATLGVYARGDSYRSLIVVPGGIPEQILFFPILRLLVDLHPETQWDVLCSATAKKAWDINPYVRRVFKYDMEMAPPDERMDMIGTLKAQYYGKVYSVYPSTMDVASLYFMSSIAERISYILPNVGGAGSRWFLTTGVDAPASPIFEAGVSMYDKFVEEALGVAANSLLPLEVGISAAAEKAAQEKLAKLRLSPRGYVLAFGLPTKKSLLVSFAGDSDTVLPLSVWAEVAKGSDLPVVFVVSREMDIGAAEEALGKDAEFVVKPSLGTLAALVRDAAALVSTNNASLLLASAFNTPSVGIYASAFVAEKFIPKNALAFVPAVGTGKLESVTAEGVLSALNSLATGVSAEVEESTPAAEPASV